MPFPSINLSRLFWAITVVASLLATLSAFSMLQKADSFDSEACGSCHLGKNKGQIKSDPILISTQETLCGSCHGDALMASHPSGIPPSMQVPDVFPLDWKGDITCSTCHETHNDKHGVLRVTERGEAFCGACHQADFFTAMADGGISTIISGHLDASGELEDPFSIQCMICHDDKGDPDQSYPVSVNRDGIIRHKGSSHPVGKSYELASTYGGYKPMTELHKSIVLPNGLMSCVSCHQGYSENHGALVSTTAGSGLCFECHQL